MMRDRCVVSSWRRLCCRMRDEAKVEGGGTCYYNSRYDVCLQRYDSCSRKAPLQAREFNAAALEVNQGLAGN